ncbi:MAG: hypothetical protein WBA12_04540 [Catalinimonas sp.]
MATLHLEQTNIAQIVIKLSATDHQVITLFEFLKKDISERTQLITSRKLEFVDFEGEKIPKLVALRAITSLIKKLREEGTLVSMMKRPA